MNRPIIISIEGPMGAGKTSLARQLANALPGRLILEQPDENPFLSDFYEQRGTALATELQFLLQRQAQWQQEATEHCIISDYSAHKDEIFTPLTLTHEERKLFIQIRSGMHYAPKPADLLIFVDAPLPILLERIHARGSLYESALCHVYLEQVQSAYRHWRMHYTQPCLDIDSSQVDFVHDPRHNEKLIKMVRYHLQAIEERNA